MKKTTLSLLGILLLVATQLPAQDTVFFSDFEFGGDVDFSIFEVADLNDADDQIGEWTGDDEFFPDADGSGFFRQTAPASWPILMVAVCCSLTGPSETIRCLPI